MTPADIADDHTFWTGTPERIAETMVAYREIGFHTFIVECPAPYDEETLERLMSDVKPLVEAAETATDDASEAHGSNAS